MNSKLGTLNSKLRLQIGRGRVAEVKIGPSGTDQRFFKAY